MTYKGTLLTQSSDTGFTFTVTKKDGSSFNPEAKDTNGLNSANYYVINIPIYDEESIPDGANPGDTVVVHAYKNGYAVELKSPPQGKIIVGESGSITQINLIRNLFTPTSMLSPIKTVAASCPAIRQYRMQ